MSFHAMLDAHAVRFTASEAWVLTGGQWLKADLIDVFNNASVIPEHEFVDIFGQVPPLPPEAFYVWAGPSCDRNGPLNPASWDAGE
jgi:hypothetical protein